MNRKLLPLIFAATLIAPGVFAQDTGYAGVERRNRRNNAANQQKMSKQWADAQTTLKKKCPEEYAEIEKLGKTNLFEAMMKFRELAAKEKIQLGGERPMNRRGGHDFGGRGGFGGDRPDFGRGGFGGDRPNFGRGGMSGGFRNSRMEAETQLKKDYPQDYAQVENLRKEAENKLQALAKKAKVQLPDTMESYRMKLETLRQKYPAEMAEADKLRETDPRAAAEKIQEIAKKADMELSLPFGFPGRFNPQQNRENNESVPAKRSNIMSTLNNVQKAYPDEWNRIRELRESDPDAARKQLQALIKKYEAEQKKK